MRFGHEPKVAPGGSGKKARHVFEKFGVLEKASKYPAQLSGGQQQVAICRSLVLGPDVMIFDEPMSALDPEMVDDVLQVLTQLVREGMTMCIVTHEMQFARDVANKILFMEAGRIIDRGSTEEFFSSGRNPRIQAFSWSAFFEKSGLNKRGG